MYETDIQGSVPGMLIRGGTSKGFLVREEDFQIPDSRRDDVLLDMFGSPGSLQIDGIGGGKSHNSKFMSVTSSDDDRYDIEYTYAGVHVSERNVSWNAISANLTSAVGPFAMLAGLVPADGNPTTVSIYNRNTRMSIEQRIPVRDDEPDVYGDYSISGIPKPGAQIETTFHDLAGAVTGDVLPTGNEVDRLDLGDRHLDVSIVDAARIAVFLRASDLDMDGTELPEEIAARDDVLETVADVRERVSEKLDLVDKHTIAILSEPKSYTGSNDETVRKSEIDLTTRLISLQPHHAIGVSPAMCLAAASRVPGTIPTEYVQGEPDGDVTIGHPKGTITLGVTTSDRDGDVTVESVTNHRTARPLMAGRAFYRNPE